MALDKDTQQQLERYLDRELTPQAQRQFEQRIAQEPAIAQAVQLHRDMEDLLGDSKENALRKNLEKLSHQFEDAPTENKPKRPYWLGILLLVGIGTAVWYFSNNRAENPVSTNKLPETENSVPLMESDEVEDDPDPTQEVISPQESLDESSEPKEKVVPKNETPSKKKREIAQQDKQTEAPLAGGNPIKRTPKSITELEPPETDVRDYFAPLDVLEAKKQASDNSTLQLIRSLPASIPLREAQTQTYTFTVQLADNASLTANDLILYVYSNSEYHWAEQTPWLAYELQVETAEKEQILNSSIQPDLETGRYYLVLQAMDKQNIYLVTDFVIVEE
ncbi:MAG: hypothetical protein AAF847_08190 [Bacteroidota bacterium]